MTTDIHVHPWTRSFVMRNPPIKAACNYFGVNLSHIPKSIADIVREMDVANVSKSVILGQDAHSTKNPAFKNYTVPNTQLAKMTKHFEDRFILFAGVDPNSGTLAIRELRYALQDLNFSGLMINSCVNEVYPSDKRVELLCELCQEFDVPVLFHTGTTALGDCDIKYGNPEYLDEVARCFPDLKIILAHFGWPWTDVALAIALRHKNVFIDVSGWKPSHLPEILLRYINGPLKEKVLFGTDYPMITQTAWMNDFESIKPKMKPEVVRNLLSLNARKLLRL